MIWRDRWFQIFIVTKPYSSSSVEKRYLVGSVKTRTKNAKDVGCVVNIDDSYTGVAANATIRLFGLKAKTLYTLASETAQYIQFPQWSYVEINAGYSNRHGVIYRGSIIKADPDMNSPDFSVLLQCDGLANVDNGEPLSAKFKGAVDVRVILKELAKNAGMRFSDKTKNKLLEYTVDDFCCNNMSVSQICCLLQYQNRNFGIHIEPSEFNSETKGTITLYDADTSVIVNGTLENKVITINDKWLIGTPTVTALGCRARIRFRPDIVGGDVVRVDSSRYKGLKNFKFVVNDIKTCLETKGNSWYKELTMVYPGVGLQGKPNIYGEKESV